MTGPISSRLERALAALPRTYAGPGASLDGMIARHSWGWANAERRIPFTPQSLFRMCSITKQFTCALMLDAFPDPTVLDADVHRHLPRLDGPAPGALHLCHNQSGMRDYWAVAMLQGAPVESAFGGREAARLIAGTRTLHFAPGTRYSYANQNFRILSDILEPAKPRNGIIGRDAAGIGTRAEHPSPYLSPPTPPRVVGEEAGWAVADICAL